MNNTLIKSLILILAASLAIGGVLFFIQTVVSPPEDIKAEDMHTSDIQQISDFYNPDGMELSKAENIFNVIVDRAILYKEDGFIEQKVCDDAITQSSEKFSALFVKWAMTKFNQPIWNSDDHVLMKRIINKLRNITVAQGSKKALESNTLSSLTKIENIIKDYVLAWKATKQTSFVPWNYNDAQSKRTNAEEYAKKEYLNNCVDLVNALNSVGDSLESSCYYQLTQSVNKLQDRFSFNSKEAYDNESSRIYDLIQTFEKTEAFGVSTSAHAKVLKDLQDSFDRAAEDHDWPENNNSQYAL